MRCRCLWRGDSVANIGYFVLPGEFLRRKIGRMFSGKPENEVYRGTLHFTVTLNTLETLFLLLFPAV
ncbi:MAG: hypothetical protein FWH04_08730 [Oscillospiraceae bacterium]|nr:hypothetical protein [Oscillospiraceae bacterium]